MQRWFYPILILLAVTVVAGTARADATRDWVARALAEALDPPDDLNAIASLVFPLTPRHGEPGVRALLRKTAKVLQGLDAASLACGQRADLLLLSGFLEEAEVQLDPPPMAGCEASPDLFGTVNTLLFACRHGAGDPEKVVPGGLARIARRVGRDGSVTGEDGQGGYYMTSHAILALYSCGGDAAAVARGQGYLLRTLPYFLRTGFLDGLAESLIFLRWMGVPVRGEGSYLGYLRSRTLPDGGLCFMDRPGCKPHWHATSLLLELNTWPERN